MKTSIFILAVFSLFFPNTIHAQEKGEKHFYSSTSGEINTIYFDEIRDNIVLKANQEETNPLMAVSAALFGIVIGELVPILVQKVGFLAYNPQNYISEYGKSYLFKKDSLINLQNIKEVVFTRTGLKNGSEKVISSFKFDLTDISKPNTESLEGYRVIALVEHQNNYTKVKLKNSGKKMSVVAEVILVYYDDEDKKRELGLQPYKLGEIVPKGDKEASMTIDSNSRNYQIIPPIKFIETLSIKITEVNDRKKDWDKYLELFNSQKGNISGFLINQLK